MKKQKFRLPRKLKKILSSQMWLYPFNVETDGYLMAWPYKNQEDYNNYKLGIVKEFFKRN